MLREIAERETNRGAQTYLLAFLGVSEKLAGPGWLFTIFFDNILLSSISIEEPSKEKSSERTPELFGFFNFIIVLFES